MSEIQFSEMVNGFKTGIFATLNEKKEELIKEGRKVYNLSVGTPDFKPARRLSPELQRTVGVVYKQKTGLSTAGQMFLSELKASIPTAHG